MKNKLLKISLILVLLTSCSGESSFETLDEQETNFTKTTNEESTKKNLPPQEDIRISSCKEGCHYNYRILSVAKELKKESMSLTLSQLKSFEESCFYFCEEKLIKNKMEKEPKENKKVVPFEEDKEFNNPDDNPEVTPFESL